ncbi:hypothetical protein QT970_22685 [Microcoleus sp. herbarium8]|uniref:hypothetical protein n=1 Tax=Microcoleus sp. herbarium8 TaxID=3055436 RepID=UPI002FCFF5A3
MIADRAIAEFASHDCESASISHLVKQSWLQRYNGSFGGETGDRTQPFSRSSQASPPSLAQFLWL